MTFGPLVLMAYFYLSHLVIWVNSKSRFVSGGYAWYGVVWRGMVRAFTECICCKMACLHDLGELVPVPIFFRQFFFFISQRGVENWRLCCAGWGSLEFWFWFFFFLMSIRREHGMLGREEKRIGMIPPPTPFPFPFPIPIYFSSYPFFSLFFYNPPRTGGFIY